MIIEYTAPKRLPEMWGLHWAAAQPMRQWKRGCRVLAGIETALLGGRIRPVADPLYICGLARSGTTITLELVSAHPDTASFCYGDMVQPYLPYAWNKLGVSRAFSVSPQERPHGDGLIMDQDRPEAVEEVFWQQWFPWVHDEARSGVLGPADADTGFDRFYRQQIGKLLLARKRRRYLAKANYHVTRLAYLDALFPSPRFVILVRHPVAHAVSYLKQQQRLSRLYRSDPRWWEIAVVLGHYEFGAKMQFINTGDARSVGQIRRLWDEDRRPEALAWYWRMIYLYLHRTVTGDPGLSRRCLFVRYEDLCRDSGVWIDRIIDHCRLDRAGFAAVRQQFCRTLSLPAYYRARMTPAEKTVIWEITRNTAELFGYQAKYISIS